MKKVVTLLAFLVFVTPAQAVTSYDSSYGERRGCKVTYPSKISYKKIKVMLRHLQPLKEIQKTRSAHYAVCVETRKKSRAVWDYVRRSYTWRKQYAHVWPIRLNEFSSGIVNRLAILRGCETRGISYPSNYYWDGHHKGAYQYSVNTWQRAQAYYAAVTGKKVVGWTWSAHVSSPSHQDVITAIFFPTHTGEWECSA